MEAKSDECPCTVNEVELFDLIAKQVVLQNFRQVVYRPTASIGEGSSVIEFAVEGSVDEFIDFNDTELSVWVKITNSDNAALKDTDVIAPINNWLHSLFSDIKVDLQNETVEGGDHLYPYKAYLYNLLSHDQNSKTNQLEISGWFKDTSGSMNLGTDANVGFKERKNLVSTSKLIQLSGPLLLDMMLQNRYLLPNTDFKLALTCNKAEFQTSIYTATTVEGRAKAVKVKIENIELKVRRVKGLSSFIQSMEDSLLTQNAMYPVQHTVMKTFTIGTGLQSYNCQNLFTGQLPKLLFIGLVRNDAYNGAYVQNPFYFRHFNVNRIKLTDSSGTANFLELTPNFTTGNVAVEYNQLMRTLGLYNKSDSVDISLKEFKDGYTIFGFNLTPDLHASGHEQVTRNATISLDLGFSAATATPLNIIAMGVFDGRVQVTKNRAIHCSWK